MLTTLDQSLKFRDQNEQGRLKEEGLNRNSWPIMQAAPLARWRWAGCGSLRGGRGSGGPVAAILPLALLLLLIGLPQGRSAAAQTRALLSPRRQPLPAPPSLEAALEAEALAEEAEALAEEAEEAEAEALGPMAAAAKRQQHQFDDYGHMRFGKRSETTPALQQPQQASPASQRTVFRRRPPTQAQATFLQQRVRKFDDYGHMRFGRSSEK